VAVPESEYESLSKQLEIFKQKNGEMIFRTREQAEKISSLQTELRKLRDGVLTQRELQESKEDLEKEYNRVRQRLEWLDPNYRWENHIFAKIVAKLKKTKMSHLQGFENYDKNKNGWLDKEEFANALAMMGVDDLSMKEVD
jgi:predicted nuclease with TOPRIM domain